MNPLQASLTDPETIVLVAGVFWITAALATGLPHRRFPSEFPFLFTMIALASVLIGVTEMVPETIDNLLTMTAVILFAITPVLVTLKLYQAYPPRENQPAPA